MKYERNYNAYKLYVSKDKVDLYLCEQFWPDGISFRRFVHYMYKQNNDEKLKLDKQGLL